MAHSQDRSDVRYGGNAVTVWQRTMLVARVGGMACAVPIEQVVETMRPLPVEPLGRSSDPGLAAIDGLAVIRGAPVPVIDVRRLLGAPCGPAERLVVLRFADRRLAILVDAITDVRQIEQATLAGLPPLLDGAGRDSVAAIGARDAALLVVLDATRVLPEDSWRALAHALPSEERSGEAPVPAVAGTDPSEPG